MTQKSRRKKINLSFLTHNFLFVGVAVCAPLSWSTGQNPNGKVGLEGFRTAICTGKGFHIKCDISASAGNLLIFLSGCAADRLLYKQTRTECSNSVCKAIAMLANPAKICQRSALGSGDIRTLIMESCQSVQMGRSTLLALSFVGRYTKQKSV